jgi:cobalt/nickel transport system permease protein
MLAAVWAACLSAGLQLGWLLRRSLLAAPFVLAALPLPFTYGGPAIAHVPWLGWPISAEGLLRLAAVLARSWLSVQAAVLLAGTTPFPAILWGLAGLHVPRVLVAVIALMYRYIFVLADEAQRMVRARAARSARLPGRRRPGLLWQARTAGNMAGVLFVGAVERSERIYAAMLARGYDGEPRLLAPPAWRAADTWLAAGGAMVLVLALAVGRAV